MESLVVIELAPGDILAQKCQGAKENETKKVMRDVCQLVSFDSIDVLEFDTQVAGCYYY